MRRIVVIGDVMLDQTTWVRVRGVSPENDAVVVAVEDQVTYNLGGAANVAHNCKTLGNDVVLLGFNTNPVVDTLIAQAGISNCIVRPKSGDTPVKNRFVTRDGHYLLRVDREKTPFSQENAFKYGTCISDKIEELLHTRDVPQPVVCLVDYDKGALDHESIKTLMYWFNAVHESFDFPIIVDPGRYGSWSRYGSPRTVFRANLLQASKFVKQDLTGFKFKGREGYETALHIVRRTLAAEHIDFRYVVLTLGAGGIIAGGKFKEQVHFQEANPVDLPDPCGAGDTVTAAIAVTMAFAEKCGDWHALMAGVSVATKAARIAVVNRGVYAVTRGDMGWRT